MATIERLPSGRWRARVRRRGANISCTFSTKGQAQRLVRWTEMAVEDGDLTAVAEACTDNPPLAEALDRYEREVTCRKKSAREERSKIRVLQRTSLARLPLGEIRPQDVAELRDQLLNEGRAEGTVRLLLALLSHLYTIARCEWGLPVENPVREGCRSRGTAGARVAPRAAKLRAER